MASDERLRELEEKYEGYKVYDNRGDRIGKVDDLFIDESDREEYIGVKMGLLGTKSTLIPMDIVRVNESDRSIEVAESKDHIKDAPTFSDDDDVTSEYEERIRSHFGLESLGGSDRGPYGGSSGEEQGSGSSDLDREDSGPSGVDAGHGERSGSTRGAGEGETREMPTNRTTEETETFEEGGRTKVRRRTVREEIIDETDRRR